MCFPYKINVQFGDLYYIKAGLQYYSNRTLNLKLRYILSAHIYLKGHKNFILAILFGDRKDVLDNSFEFYKKDRSGFDLYLHPG